MTTLSPVRDVTHIVRSATPTPPLELLYITCAHKGPRRGGLPMRCPRCNLKAKP